MSNHLDSRKDKITRAALVDVCAQLKKKKMFLILNNNKIIGELVACTLDKKGIKGNFVISSNLPNYYLILTGIANKFFSSFSFRYNVKECKIIRGVRHIQKLELLDVKLCFEGCNKACLVEEKSRDLAADILILELKKIEGLQ